MKDSLMAKKRKNKNLILLLSLIIHLIIILLIIIFAFKKLSEKETPKTLLSLKKNELPASLKPRKSEFGTTVIFDDLPQFTPPKEEMMAQQEIQKKRDEILPKKEITAQADAIEEEKPKQNIIPKENIDINLINKITILTEKDSLKEEHKDIEHNKTDKISNLKKEPSQKKITEEIKPIIKTEIIRSIGTAKKDMAPEPPKRKSILAMTKGFLQNLKDEGNDWIKRDGDDNKRPDAQDLKQISYDQRIAWCFQNETGILYSQMPFQEKRSLLSGFRMNPTVFFTINENGYLNKISIIQSSGSSNFDKHVLTAFKNASPYPPIPKHLNTKIYERKVQIINQNR
ncbi:MAG: TonB family protein [bacterium]